VLNKEKVNRGDFQTLRRAPAPNCLETNWIPTAGKRPLPAVRFYGPIDAFNNKTFKLPDFELVS